VNELRSHLCYEGCIQRRALQPLRDDIAVGSRFSTAAIVIMVGPAVDGWRSDMYT